MEEIRIAEIDKEKTGACRSGQKAKQGPSLACPLQVCKEQEALGQEKGTRCGQEKVKESADGWPVDGPSEPRELKDGSNGRRSNGN